MLPSGTITGLFAKPLVPGESGLPKRPLVAASVDLRGVVGDHNRYRTRRCGGDPDMALLLLSSETLPLLRQAGWPVEPGDLGENLLVSGLGPGDFGPGQPWSLGLEVVAEIARPCEPCRTLARLPYVGRERVRSFMAALDGQRGWYARVLRGGTIYPGDAIGRLDRAPG